MGGATLYKGRIRGAMGWQGKDDGRCEGQGSLRCKSIGGARGMGWTMGQEG